MTALQIVFLITAVVTLGSALMVVTSRHLIHAAFWLILSLFGVAVLYVVLNAGFLAVAQVVIYIGAIAILVIFAVMMTRTLVEDFTKQLNAQWWVAALLSVVLFAGLAWMLGSWDGFSTPLPPMAVGADPLRQLGVALVSPNAYVIPFELASVLLLGALIGSLLIARERKI
jgi:NADH-quinone oxidoreductase subunit J